MAIYTYTSPVTAKTRKDGGDSVAYNYYLTVDVLSQSVVDNTSTVAVSLLMYAGNNSGTKMWATSAANAPITSVSVDGNTYNSTVNLGSSTSTTYIAAGKFRAYYRSSTAIVLCTKTLTVQHGSDGTKSLSVSYKWTAGSGTTTSFYPITFTSSTYTVSLPTIIRGSQITCDGSVLLSNSTDNFSYSVTSYENYWHLLSYELDGSTITVWGTAHNIDNATEAMSISYATLLSQVTTGTVKNLKFTLSTYADSGLTTLVGTVVKTVVVSVDTSVYCPTTTLVSITPHTTPLTGSLVAGYSTADISFTATTPTGATSVTTYFSASTSITLATTSTTATSGSVYSNTLTPKESNYTFAITAYSVDSRGVTSTPVTLTSPTVYGYKLPVITVQKCYRVATNGATTEDAAGEWVYVLYNAAIYFVDGNNALMSKDCTYVEGSQTYNTSPAWFYQLAPESSGTFVFTATDKVATATTQRIVPPAKYPLDLYDDGTALHIGVGLAGSLAEADKVKSAKDVYAPNFIGDLTGDATGDLYNTDSSDNVRPVAVKDASDNVEVNAIGGALKLGAQNTTLIDILSAFYKLTATGFRGSANGNETDANDLIPQTDTTPKLGDIGVWFSDSRNNRTNWPSSSIQNGFIITIVIQDGGAYLVQFSYMNTQAYLYQRIRNNGTWGTWKKVTFS